MYHPTPSDGPSPARREFALRKFTRLILATAFSVGAITSPAPLSSGVAQAEQGDQGLQGGWAVDNSGNINFLHSVSTQLPVMQQAGAGWVRINFRLGGCFNDWDSPGCNDRAARDIYKDLVALAEARSLRIVGLLSPESWHGSQAGWIANNAEVAGGNGDNPYIRDFADRAAGVLAAHLRGRVAYWQIWNEPNAWTELDGNGNPTGGTFVYPSNFAWMLKRSSQAIKLADRGAQVISGGIFGHDVGGQTTTSRAADGTPRRVTKRGELVGGARAGAPPPEPAGTADPCKPTVPSGADYLCATYEMGLKQGVWPAGASPLDHLGQHIYVDQGTSTSATKISTHLGELRNAFVKYEGTGTSKKTHVTEVGWSTAMVNRVFQARNLRTAFRTFKTTSYVGRAFWFFVQDIPEASLYYGLVDTNGRKKPSFQAYQETAI